MNTRIIFNNRKKQFKTKRLGCVTILLLVLSLTFPLISFNVDNALPRRTTQVQYLPSAPILQLNLSYTSRTDLSDIPINSGDTIAGDHVVVKAEWTESLVNRSRLEINAHAIPSILSIEANQSTLEIDTRALGNNASCTITCTGWLNNGTTSIVEFTNVYIGNYFVPTTKVIAPNGGEDWTGIHNITWTASDMNVDDTLLFDVLLSSDSGGSFETLISSTNRTWFELDCTNLIRSDKYLVRIRVTDGIYYYSDSSDDTFTAGTAITSTTSPPTSTPTNTTNGLEPRILAFVAILLFSCGVMALVVYYAARKWV